MKNYLAEFVGTFTMVFCGTGAIVIDQVSGGMVGHLSVSITFGAIVMAVIYAIGDRSGAHINPAVSIAFAVSGQFAWSKVPGYLLSQFLGGILASLVLWLLFPGLENYGMTLPAGSVMQSFVLEIILTFFLMFVILQVSSGSKESGMMAGAAVGAVVLLEALFAGPISGASMNPARSLAPAMISGQLNEIWIYLLAPTIGAALSVIVWRLLK
jgi:aquaporin NIP